MRSSVHGQPRKLRLCYPYIARDTASHALRRCLDGVQTCCRCVRSIRCALGWRSAAPAVVGGTPDQAHPYVGALLRIDSQSQTYFLCTGSLLGSRWFLTAGHCLEEIGPGDHPVVSFDPKLEGGKFDPATGQTDSQPDAVPADTWITDPALSDRGNNSVVNDVGLVHLTTAVHKVGGAALPTTNVDSTLVTGQSLTAVGYGVDSLQPPGIATWTGTRQWAHGVFNGLTPDSLDARYDGSAGAPCYGDSGAPLFAGDSSNVVLGIVSWGSMGTRCGGLQHNQRVDTPAIRSWLLREMRLSS